MNLNIVTVMCPFWQGMGIPNPQSELKSSLGTLVSFDSSERSPHPLLCRNEEKVRL
jgi:hypothetical protein